MLKLFYLKYFIETANLGSINKAADKFMLKQSNLSTIIQKLEKHFNTKLFFRTNFGVVLTEEGHMVYDWAQMVLYSQNELMTQINKTNHPFTHVYFYSLPAANTNQYSVFAEQIVQKYPDIEFTFRELNLNNLLNELETVPGSIAHIYLTDKQLKTINTSKTTFVPIILSSLFVAVPKNNFNLENRSSISLEELLHLPILLYGLDKMSFLSILDSHREPNNLLSVSNLNYFYSMFASKRYVTIVQSLFCNRIGNTECITIPIEGNIKTHVGFLLRNAEKDLPFFADIMEIVTKNIVLSRSRDGTHQELSLDMLSPIVHIDDI